MAIAASAGRASRTRTSQGRIAGRVSTIVVVVVVAVAMMMMTMAMMMMMMTMMTMMAMMMMPLMVVAVLVLVVKTAEESNFSDNNDQHETNTPTSIKIYQMPRTTKCVCVDPLGTKLQTVMKMRRGFNSLVAVTAVELHLSEY